MALSTDFCTSESNAEGCLTYFNLLNSVIVLVNMVSFDPPFTNSTLIVLPDIVAGIGFIAGASGAVETAMSFTEFLQEELAGKEFTNENIREVLEDEDRIIIAMDYIYD